MFFDYPNEQDWSVLEGTYPFERLDIPAAFFEDIVESTGIDAFITNLELSTWVIHLQNRLIHARISYVMLMFYFRKGIPDEEWYISPGRNGESVQYFPHFKEKDHWTQVQFFYYADVFYYKLFSAWNTLGHILNLIYDLGKGKPDFNNIQDKLKAVNPDLHRDLEKEIFKNSDFINAQQLRNNITHNFLPSHIGSNITRTHPTEHTVRVGFGVGTYTPSREIRDNIVKALDLFVKTLEIIVK